MSESQDWYLQRADGGERFGPLTRVQLQGWADEGLISARDQISLGAESGIPAGEIEGLGMTFLVETLAGEYYGPTTRGAILTFLHNGQVTPESVVLDVRDGLRLTVAKLTQPLEDAKSGGDAPPSAPPSAAAAAPRSYAVFISYRHADNLESGRQWATWLHHSLETYEPPPELVGRPNLRGQPVKSSLFPVFRDEEELSADSDLSINIRRALERSSLLVVICSPRAVASRFVADEIRYFKELGKADRILAFLIDGEPNTSDDTQKQAGGLSAAIECLPEPLRFGAHDGAGVFDWALRTEPIAADARPGGHPEQGWTTAAAYRQALTHEGTLARRDIDERVRSYEERLQLARLKIVAGALEVPLGELTQREKAYQLVKARQRARRLRVLAGVFGVLALAAVGAAVMAFYQRRVAEHARVTAEHAQTAAETSERHVRSAASQAQFAAAVDGLRRDEGVGALAHLAKALRIDPRNGAAAVRLASLLAQRSWPVALREYGNEFSVRQIVLHPDGQRLVTSSAFDAYESKGIACAQIFDWRANRLLAAPDLVYRNDSSGLLLSEDGSVASVSRQHKESGSTIFLPLPPAGGAKPLEIPASRMDREIYNRIDLCAIRGDGRVALVSTEEGGGDSARYLIMPTDLDPFRADDPRLIELTWEKPATDPETKFTGHRISLPLAAKDTLLQAWFEGERLVLLAQQGTVLEVDTTTSKTARRHDWPGNAKTSLAQAARASASGHVALLYADGSLVVRDAKSGAVAAGPLALAPGGKWPAELLPPAAASGDAPDAGGVSPAASLEIQFCQDEKSLCVRRRTTRYDKEEKPRTGFWRLAGGGGDGAATALEWRPAGWTPLGKTSLCQTDGQNLRLVNSQTGAFLCESFPHESAVLCSHALGDHLVATGTAQGVARVWTRSDALWPTPAFLGEEQKSQSEDDVVTFAVAPGGKQQLIGKGIRRRSTPFLGPPGSEKPLSLPPWDGVRGGSFSSDGRYLVVRGANGLEGSTVGASDKGAQLCDAATGRVLGRLMEHDECSWVGFDPTGRWVVTAGNGYIQCWSIPGGEPTGPRLEQPGVCAVAWDPHQSTHLLSTTENGDLRVWDLERRTLLLEKAWPGTAKEPENAPEVREIVFSPDGERFFQREPRGIVLRATASGDGLTDAVPPVLGSERLRYEEIARQLGWGDMLLETNFEPAAEALAAAGEAMAGLQATESGALAPVGDRTAAFQGAIRVVAGIPAAHPLSVLLRHLLEQSQFAPLRETPADTLAARGAEARAAYPVTLAAYRAAEYPTPDEDSKRIDLLDNALDPERIDGLKKYFQTARRISPADGDRLAKGLIAGWENRTDPLGAFVAVQMGDNGQELRGRAATYLGEYEILLGQAEYASDKKMLALRERYRTLLAVETACRLEPVPKGAASVTEECAFLDAAASARTGVDALGTKGVLPADATGLQEAYAPLHKFFQDHPKWDSARAHPLAILEKCIAELSSKPDAEALQNRIALADGFDPYERACEQIVFQRIGILPYLPAGDPRRLASLTKLLPAMVQFAANSDDESASQEFAPVYTYAREFLQSKGDPEELAKFLGNRLYDERFPWDLIPPALKGTLAHNSTFRRGGGPHPLTLRLLQEAVAGGVKDPNLRVDLANELSSAGKSREAAEAFAGTAAMLPTGSSDRIRMLLAASANWRRAGDEYLDNAEKAIAQAAAGSSTAAAVVLERARVFQARKRYEPARAEYQRAISMGQAAGDTALMVGAVTGAAGCLDALGRHPEAEAAVEEGLALTERNVELLRTAGWSAFERQSFAKALAYWQEADKKMGEDNADLLAGLSVGYYAVGDRAKAVASYRRLMKHEPDYGKPEFVKALTWSSAQKAAMEAVLAWVREEK